MKSTLTKCYGKSEIYLAGSKFQIDLGCVEHTRLLSTLKWAQKSNVL